jgi:hypothetical protein
MPSPLSAPTRISIGSLHRQPGTPTAASADAVQGLRHGLADLGAAVTGHRVPSGPLQLPALSIRLRPGAGAREIAEEVRRVVDGAIRERLG